MSYEKNITFLPWVHSTNYQNHYENLEFLNSLKPGSTVGLEINPNMLGLMNKFLNKKMRGENLEKELIYNILKNRNKQMDAMLQAIFTCNRKGLKIVPLQRDQIRFKKRLLNFNPFSLYASSNKAEKTKKQKQELIKKDKEMAQSIIEYLKTKDNIYVLTGVTHNKGIFFRVNELFEKTFSKKYKLNTQTHTKPEKYKRIMLKMVAEHSKLYFNKVLDFDKNGQIPEFETAKKETKQYYDNLFEKEISEAIEKYKKRIERKIREKKEKTKTKKKPIKKNTKHKRPR